jgi:Astacin (Peptidase family M12A)/Right handed beta helix region
MITIKKVIYSSCSKSENEPNRQFVEKSLNSPFCQKLTTWDILKNFRPAARADWAWLFLTWLLTTGPLLAGNFYTNYTSATVPWPGGIVPYEFTNTLTAVQQQTYLDGLREWELAANVKFVPHTNQTHWILFTYNTNYLDNVAPGYNPQVVTISSLSRSQVCHEMGHSFGFNHENIRTDQTNYLTVIANNITPGNLQFFLIDSNTFAYGNYDFESVMHLGWDFASIQPGVLSTQQPQPPYSPRYQFRMGNFCLSPGDRAALAHLYGPPAVPLTNIVSTTADVGPGSLRAAIYFVTDHPGSVVKFNIPATDPGYSNGVFNIHLTGHLPPLVSNGMVIDGSTQPGFAGQPLIFVDGSQIIPETFTSNSGLLIYSSSNQVKNISFSGFNWNGLTLEYADATNNTIAGCWLGLDAAGTNATPNAYQGILFADGAGHNIVGGTNPSARNVISGNAQYGIWMSDSNTTGNTVLGNYIGTDASGSVAVPNAGGGIGMFYSSVGHVIGGTNANARNVISGNGNAGIWLAGSGVSNNLVEGNLIGLDAAGTFAVPNTFAGIYVVNGASGNAILNNVISGNYAEGLHLSDPGTTGNLVQGNFIGTDSTGASAVPNGFLGLSLYSGAAGNTIGGTTVAARNLISGNASEGLRIQGVGATGNLVQGNYIGTDAGGASPLPNGWTGLTIFSGATSNIIGGTVAAARNVISGNSAYGVVVADAGTSGNLIQGNYIGPGVDGMSAVPNNDGILFSGGATNNLLGGTSAGAANFVSGNAYRGISISDPGTSGNFIRGNFIGTDHTGTNALGNFDNVELQAGATGNLIGGVGAGAGNVIAFANGTGVILYDAATTNNSIRGNAIFNNHYLGIDLNGDGVTANHTGFLIGPNDFQNFPVITNAFGSGAGTIVEGTLNSVAGQSYIIDVYRSFSPDDTLHGEGQIYIGSVSVTTAGSGNVTFALTNGAGNFAGQYISATATAADGDTSEFSADLLAVNQAVASANFTGPYQARTNGFAFTLLLQTNFTYRIQATANLATKPVVWVDLTNFNATSATINFIDRTATNFSLRFYRVISP